MSDSTEKAAFICVKDTLDGGNDDGHHDNGRGDGPGDFQTHVAMDLLGLTLARFLPKPDEDIGHESPHHDQDDHGPPEHRDVDVMGDLPVVRHRVDGGLQVLLPAGRQKGHGQERSRPLHPAYHLGVLHPSRLVRTSR